MIVFSLADRLGCDGVSSRWKYCKKPVVSLRDRRACVTEEPAHTDETIENRPCAFGLCVHSSVASPSLSVLSRKSVSCDLECTCRIYKKLKTPNTFLTFFFFICYLWIFSRTFLVAMHPFLSLCYKCYPNGNALVYRMKEI